MGFGGGRQRLPIEKGFSLGGGVCREKKMLQGRDDHPCQRGVFFLTKKDKYYLWGKGGRRKREGTISARRPGKNAVFKQGRGDPDWMVRERGN